jgi:hypothetical protein
MILCHFKGLLLRKSDWRTTPPMMPIARAAAWLRSMTRPARRSDAKGGFVSV